MSSYASSAYLLMPIKRSTVVITVITCVVLGTLSGLIVFGITLEDGEGIAPEAFRPFFLANVVLGILSWVFLPKAFGSPYWALATVACGVSGAAFPAVFVALTLLSARKGHGWMLTGVSFLVGTFFVESWLSPVPYEEPWWIIVAILLGFFALPCVVVGMNMRRRWELKLRDREEAQNQERERIALDVHDSISHRLSLISVYSSALALRDLDSDKVKSTAATIQQEAEGAVQDLREILRDVRERNDPRDSFDVIVEEAREAGDYIHYQANLKSLPNMPTQVKQAASRALRECLTNARKHASGQPVTVTTEFASLGKRRRLLRVTVANSRWQNQGSGMGTGNGLLGMRRRIEAVGGNLSINDTDPFVVSFELPVEE